MKNKLFSIFTALAMVLGILVSPFTSAHAAEGDTPDPANVKVKVHKILMNDTDMEKHDGNKKYDPTKGIDNLTGFFGESAKEIPNVYFVAIKKGEEGFDDFKTKSLAEKKAIVATAKENGYLKNTSKGEGDIVNPAEFSLPNGTEDNPEEYNIYEVEYLSTYKSTDGKVLTNSMAVPVKISLPEHAKTSEGVASEINVYPKNTEDKPKIDKNFAKAKQGEKELEEAEGFDKADKGAGIGVGADIKNYDKKKATAKAELGKKIPYEVKTQIPAQSKLQQAKWEDNMTDGLTFNRDLEVKIGDQKLIKNTDYSLYQTDKGFVLRLTEEGLKLVNGKTDIIEVVLLYSATVNKDAIVDQPEKNDVTFNYGNNPTNENDPVPGKPNDQGELKVEKTWDDGVWAKEESATFELRDAKTGRKVTADDLVEPTDKEAKAVFEAYKKSFNAEVTIGYPGKDAEGKQVTNTSAAWKYLDPEKEYVAVETKSTSPSDVEYVKGEDGTLKATNHKRPEGEEPNTLKPTSPQVVLGGKKFVKTNTEGERLPGAEFYVKNAEGKYLVAKDAATVEANTIKNEKASETYKKAVEDYNAARAVEGVTDDTVKITVPAPTDEDPNATVEVTGKAAIEAKIAELYSEYKKAFKEQANKYDWGKKEDAIILVSDDQGRFEITGLEYGKYKLEEKSAPAGYAKLNGEIDFTVAKGSYVGPANGDTATHIQYDKENGSDDNKGQQIENKKVTIPQTGGIGSLIFVVAGLAIMAGAYAAYRKSQARA